MNMKIAKSILAGLLAATLILVITISGLAVSATPGNRLPLQPHHLRKPRARTQGKQRLYTRSLRRTARRAPHTWSTGSK